MSVHVAAVPLVGPFEVAERALGRLYPDQLALHTVVILEEPDGACTAYDFLPLQPTLPLTISRYLTPVHGIPWQGAEHILSFV